MKMQLSVRMQLDGSEYFTATERLLGTSRSIQAHRISQTTVGDGIFYCHGPKLTKSGATSKAKDGCVRLRAEALPIPLLEKIQAALAPHLAAQEPTGSEAARQAALG